MIEMREKGIDGDDGDDSSLIDTFEILANYTNCNKEIQLDGDLEAASISFKYELSCTDLSACQPVPNMSLAACSKTSETHIQNIFIIKCMCTCKCILGQNMIY